MASVLSKANWLQDLGAKGLVRPYVFVRTENRVSKPGSVHSVDWFPHAPLYKDPLFLSSLPFAERILHVESQAFGGAGLAMPRWVFYDCAVVPGFTAGFAMHRSALPKSYQQIFDRCPSPGHLNSKGSGYGLLGAGSSATGAVAVGAPAVGAPGSIPPSIGSSSASDDGTDWFPISLFIIIPTMHEGEWVAHNLCAINSIVPEADRLYGLGFLTKAFGLWYANVEFCCGMTQWGSPALKLHSHFGHLQILTAYTPTHTHANTMTYDCVVEPSLWSLFFTRGHDIQFNSKFKSSGLKVDPANRDSQIELQLRIEKGEGPFFLSPEEIANHGTQHPLTLFTQS